jgi:hypothetical protein
MPIAELPMTPLRFEREFVAAQTSALPTELRGHIKGNYDLARLSNAFRRG